MRSCSEEESLYRARGWGHSKNPSRHPAQIRRVAADLSPPAVWAPAVRDQKGNAHVGARFPTDPDAVGEQATPGHLRRVLTAEYAHLLLPRHCLARSWRRCQLSRLDGEECGVSWISSEETHQRSGTQWLGSHALVTCMVSDGSNGYGAARLTHH
jgi:hypothetical protein